jgi:hypothetical protein
MMFSPVSVHQELAEKQKPPTHQGGGFIPPAEILFGEFPHHTSSGTFVPDQGHLSSPLPGCQTRLRVIPDVGSQRIQFASGRNKILCHSRRTGLSLPAPRIRASPRKRRALSEKSGVAVESVSTKRKAEPRKTLCENPSASSEAFTIRHSGVSVLSADRKRGSVYPIWTVRKSECKWGRFYAPAVA